MGDGRRMGAGWAGVAAGVLGVASAGVMLVWTPQVAPGVVRYPFSLEQFQAIQTWFFVHHLLLVAVAVGFAGSPSLGARGTARGGAWLAVIGLIGLSVMELVAIQFADLDMKTANEGAMGAGYGIATTLVGLGMLAAGWGVIRERRWAGFWGLVPMLIGASHFLVVTPALFSNAYVAARLAIGGWMALFGCLGWALLRQDEHARGLGAGHLALGSGEA